MLLSDFDDNANSEAILNKATTADKTGVFSFEQELVAGLKKKTHCLVFKLERDGRVTFLSECFKNLLLGRIKKLLSATHIKFSISIEEVEQNENGRASVAGLF